MTEHAFLANPRGFCAGVERAILIVERALEKYGAPIYVRHEVVHNRFVVDQLKAKGAIFIEDLDEVPAGATLIFSAHGVSLAVRDAAAARGFQLFDATCPLVTKVHLEVKRLVEQGYAIVMIGHPGHPEVEGTLGQVNGQTWLVETVADVTLLASELATELATEIRLAYVTQTTLSVDDAAQVVTALKTHFPHIVGPKKDDICYATQNRQDAVKDLAKHCDLILVVGSPNSSNSNRLREVAERIGSHAHLIDDASQIDPAWLIGARCVGITAGASAPEILVEGVTQRLRELGINSVETLPGAPEAVHFPIPIALR
jgi:4-hydroxy-3-methylbut-2-en-1-yl diphosphate reductase